MQSVNGSTLVGQVIGERYWLLSEIVADSLWWADDFERSEPVAIHLVDDVEDESEFIAMVSRAAALEHPNLLPILDWGLDLAADGRRLAWVATELPTGGSLRDMLNAGRLVTPSQALVMGLELARALDHLHQRGFVHGQVRPENLFFGTDQRMRLATLSVQTVSEASTPVVDADVDRVLYMSPEQARGLAPDARCDVYSLALTLNEAVAGLGPDSSDSVAGLRLERGDQEVNVSAMLGGLAPVISACGRLDRTTRTSAAELAAALLGAAESMPRPAAVPLVPLPPPDLDSEALLGDPGLLAEAQEEVRQHNERVSSLAAFEEIASSVPPADRSLNAEVVIPGFHDAEETPVEDPGLPDEPAFTSLDELDRTEAALDQPEAVLDVPVPTHDEPVEADLAAFDEDDDFDAPWWPVLVLGLLMAAAAVVGAWFFLVDQTAASEVVPELVGRSDTELESIVAERGWSIDRVETRSEGTVPGTILAQDPEPLTEMAPGGVLTVTVSLGNPMVEIPAGLAGLTVEQAQAQLNAAGLDVGALVQENNESLSAGLVVGVDEATLQKAEGETVRLRVSLGPQPREVPAELVGLTLAEATEKLAGLRLGLVEEQTYHPTAAIGVVVAVDPPGGTVVDADSRVTVTTSAGPEPVEVPDVTDLTLAEARALIESIGLVFLDSEGTPGNPAIGTKPPAGEVHDVGTEVIVILGEDESDDEDDESEDG